MSQVFPRWSDAAARTVWVTLGALFVGIPVFLMAWVRTPYVTAQYAQLAQPIPFDHRHHVVDDGIDCLYCHTDAERGPSAGVPPTETCLNCHSQVWNRSPLLAPVWRSRDTATPIVWQRVNSLPDFVYFNHSIHLNKGIGCESCHGRVDEMARVYQVAPLTMGWCLDCHRHPAPYLRPRTAVTTMGYEPDRPRAQLAAELTASYHVRSLTNCTTCHR